MRCQFRRLIAIALFLFLGTPYSAGADDGVPAWAKVSKGQKDYADAIGIPVAFENHIGMRFVLVVPATFRMGPPEKWARRLAADVHRPWPHDVQITKPYYLQTREITNAQYRRLVPKHVSADDGEVEMNADELPVTAIAWHEAVEFLEQLKDSDPKRRTYRLPSEAEWEMAARAGTTKVWYWGDRADDGHDYERFTDAARAPGPARPGSLKPNPWGLYDLLGNVAEFTGDTAAPLADHALKDPRGVGVVEEPLKSLFRNRIVRGGTFKSRPQVVRPWFRNTVNTWSNEYSAVGFRAVVPVLRDPPPFRKVKCEVRVRAGEDGRPLDVPMEHTPRQGKIRRITGGRFDLQLHHPRDSYTWRLDLPKGRRLFHASLRKSVTHVFFDTAPFTKRVVYDVPVFRKVLIQGALAIPDGEQDDGPIAWLERIAADPQVSLFSKRPTGIAKLDARGRFRIENVPWMPGVAFTLMAGTAVRLNYGRDMAKTVIVMPGTYKPTLKLPSAMQIREGIRFERPKPHNITGVGGGPPPAKFENYEVSGTGSVRLVCKHADGRPLVGAVVLRNPVRDPKAFPKGLVVEVGDLAISGPDGSAHFPAVPVGEQRFEVIAHSRPMGVVVLDIRAGKRRVADARLPASAKIRLMVKAPSGRGAAWARFGILSPTYRPWQNVDSEGVQHVGNRCDHVGGAVLHNVPPGPGKLQVLWLGHRTLLEIDPKPGKTLDVTVRLAKPR